MGGKKRKKESRLENKWQTPGQINYVSTKLSGRVRRGGAGAGSRANAAIWPVRGRTSAGVSAPPRNRAHFLTDIYVSLSIDIAAYVVRQAAQE